MFGYITVNYRTLSKEGKKLYKQTYCSLCNTLASRYGKAGTSVLSYDMCFLILLLQSVYPDDAIRSVPGRCAINPFKKMNCKAGKVFDYAAAMNVFLAYYKALDDWNDDKKKKALKKAEALKKFLPGIKAAYPRQCEGIEKSLAELALCEKTNEISIDIPSALFGRIMGEVFVCKDSCKYANRLFALGESMGRFLYILDSYIDLKDDIKKRRYNALTFTVDIKCYDILCEYAAQAAKELSSFGITADANMEILQNIIYSGLWLKYKGEKNESL